MAVTLFLSTLVLSCNGTTRVRHLVEMKGVAFQPGTIAAHVGDTVVWINHDIVAHSATASDTLILNSAPIAPGDSTRLVVRRAGSINYHCALHPTMVGMISVQ